jgi:hypothetical protein
MKQKTADKSEKDDKAEALEQSLDNFYTQADMAVFAAALVLELAGNIGFGKNGEKNNADQKNNENPFLGKPEHKRKYSGMEKFIQGGGAVDRINA